MQIFLPVCSGLPVRYSPKAHVLKAWSLLQRYLEFQIHHYGGDWTMRVLTLGLD